MTALRYLLLLLLSAVQLGATTYYIDFVGGSDSNSGTSTSTPFKRCPGDPDATGNATFTTPAPGDTIAFKGGVTYSSGNEIALKSSGSSVNQITYDGMVSGFGTGRAVLSGTTWNLNNRDYNTIQDFEIKNWLGQAIYQEMVAPVYSGTVINNNLIHDGTQVPKAAIFINSTQNALISNNEIYNIDYIASHQRGWGIHFHGRIVGGGVVYTPGNVIKGNRIYRTGNSHISMFGQSNCTITENILGPDIYDPHSQGITYYYNQGPVTITRNYYKGERGALTLEGLEGATVLIANNVFDSLDKVGYVIASWGPGATGVVRVINNVIIGSSSQHCMSFLTDTYSAVVIKNNIIDGGGDEGSDHTNNLWVNAGAPPEAGGVYETNLSNIFVNHTNGDYRLKSGSPAIGKGANVSVYGVITDLTGAARTGTYDIGAYESGAAPPATPPPTTPPPATPPPATPPPATPPPATPPPATPPVSGPPVTPSAGGLVAAYGFEEGSGAAATDSSGSGNTGTINGATRTAQGKSGRGLSFDGTSDFVEVKDSPSLDLSSAMTLEAWVYPTEGQSGWRTIVQRERDAYFLHAGNVSGALYPGAGGTFNGALVTVLSPSAIPVDSWTHLAVTYDGNALRLYVNGTQVATQAVTGTIETNNKSLRLGGNVPYGEHFQGVIDEVRIYDGARTPSQIQQDSNARIEGGAPAPPAATPTPTTASTPTPAPAPTTIGLVAAYAFEEGSGAAVADISENGNTGAINGATWATQGKSGRALSFDGTSDLVEVKASPSLDLSSAMTLAAWVYPTASQSGWRAIVQREVDAYFLHASSTAGDLYPAGGVTLNGERVIVSSPSAIPVNSWSHLALTYDGAALRLYVNGRQVGTRVVTGNIETNNNSVRIGGNVPYGEYFQGLIDEVRIYDQARPSEIQELSK